MDAIHISYIVNTVAMAAVMALVYKFWACVEWVYSAIGSNMTASLTINSRQSRDWENMLQWIDSQHMTKVSLAHFEIGNGIGTDLPDVPRLVPGDTVRPYVFHFEGYSIRIAFYKSDMSRAPIVTSNYMDSTQPREAVISMTSWWSRPGDMAAFFERLLAAMHAEYQRVHVKNITLITRGEANNSYVSIIQQRSFSTLTLSDGLAETAIVDAEKFFSAETRAFYAKHQLPYRRGWLLEGPPGNGKSSFIIAIATYFRLRIQRLSVGSEGVSDNSLQMFLKRGMATGAPILIVIEDVDCLFGDRAKDGDTEKKKTSTATLSGLLNALDGLGAPENTIVIMTTNYAERLDAALIRPGRIDRRFVFAGPTDAMIREHYCKFFPDATETQQEAIVAACRTKIDGDDTPLAMARVQEMILRERT